MDAAEPYDFIEADAARGTAASMGKVQEHNMPGSVRSTPRNLAEHAPRGMRGNPGAYVSVFGNNETDTETRRSRWVRVAVALAIGVGTLGLAYIVYAAVTWYQYGRVENAADSASKSRLDQFMPIYEVGEVHEIEVAAPAELTFAAALQLDLQRSPLVQAIFTARTLPGRLRGEEPVSFARGILDETRAIGWGTLADVPGEEVIMGAVTRPWDSSPTFQALPPDQFASFNEPGYAKIVWTLSVEPRGDEHSVFRTVTRVQTTDSESRQKFRRYWATLSPGILVIRLQALSLVQSEAELRAKNVTDAPARDMGGDPGP